jgi:hypothetical protein
MDNPKKKKADGKRVSQQPHEQAYQKRKASKSTKSSNNKKKPA